MKKRLVGITLWGGAALLLTAPVLAQAETGPEGDGIFNGPVLSRFLPGADQHGDSLSQQFRPSRFRLGFFTTAANADAGAENETLTSHRREELAAPPRLTALASLGYGPYYGATRLATSKSFLRPDGITASALPGVSEQTREDDLSLSLEAGVHHQAFNAGLLYAYQSGYPSANGKALGNSFYPSYIFTPLGLGEQPQDAVHPEGHAVFLYLGYNPSQQLNLRGSLGLAKTTSEDKSHGLGEQSRRWGLDFAATYRLLDNLVYEAHLGYVSIDDASAPPTIPTLHGPSDGVPLSAGGQTESLYHIGSHIRMTF